MIAGWDLKTEERYAKNTRSAKVTIGPCGNFMLFIIHQHQSKSSFTVHAIVYEPYRVVDLQTAHVYECQRMSFLQIHLLQSISSGHVLRVFRP